MDPNNNNNNNNNCQSEGYENNFIVGNNYSVGLQQATDVVQDEQSFSNNQGHYVHYNNVNPPNNCFYTSNDENVDVPDHNTPHTQISLAQSAQYYSQVPSQQQIIYNNNNNNNNNNVNTRQVSNQNLQFSQINSQMNYTELFKIEVSGIEIIVRQRSFPKLNQNYLEMQQQHEEQISSNLSNRSERIKNRMHPYYNHNDQNYRIINRNPNVIFQQQHHFSMHQQKNNVSGIDRTSVNENANNINITQNTLVNQSSVFTQRTNSFEDCNNFRNKEL